MYRLRNGEASAIDHLRLWFYDKDENRIPVVRCTDLVQENIKAGKKSLRWIIYLIYKILCSHLKLKKDHGFAQE